MKYPRELESTTLLRYEKTAHLAINTHTCEFTVPTEKLSFYPFYSTSCESYIIVIDLTASHGILTLAFVLIKKLYV